MKTVVAVAVVVVVILALASSAFSQGIAVSGGSSTLFDASGAQIRAYLPNSETALSGGVFDGRIHFGATENFSFGRWGLQAGTTSLPFMIVTDFEPSATIVPALGVIATHKNEVSKWVFFGGGTADQLQFPFFFSSKFVEPTGGVFYERKLSSALSFQSSEVISGTKVSAIQSVVFHPSKALTLAGAAGVGSNSPFAGLRAAYEGRQFSGVISYTKRGAGFQRIVVPKQTVTENSGLDARGVWTTSHFNLTASRNSFLSDFQTISHSTVNSVGIGANVSIFNASANTFYGKTNDRIIKGDTAGVGAKVSFVNAHVDWYRAAGTSLTSASVTEHLSRHISVSQFLQNHSLNFGGEWHSNTLTAAVGYSMVFTPVTGMFQKVLSVQLGIQLPHGTRLDAATVTDPAGKVRWTVVGNSYGQGPLAGSLRRGKPVSGKYAYVGRLVDEKSQPVEGAVVVGKTILYCNHHGEFVLPTNHRSAQSLMVSPDDFVATGKWGFVSGPKTIIPESPVVLVVRQVIEVAELSTPRLPLPAPKPTLPKQPTKQPTLQPKLPTLQPKAIERQTVNRAECELMGTRGDALGTVARCFQELRQQSKRQEK